MKNDLAVFDEQKIRRVYDEETETWFFSVIDVIQILISQNDYKLARNYWKVLKNRLKKEGNQSVTKCNQLKMVLKNQILETCRKKIENMLEISSRLVK